jgi:hypothetical protein
MAEKKVPKWELQDALHRGRAALRLARQCEAKLGPRLQEGQLDGMSGRIDQLAGSPADRQATRTEQKGLTGTERTAADRAHEWVIAIRNMGRRTAELNKGERKALGVGEKLSPAETDRVLGAIKAIIKAFDKQAGLAAKMGVIPEDVDKGRRLDAELSGADAQQVEVMGEGKDKTFDKNVVQMALEADVDKISSRGRMAYLDDPAMRARFDDLVSSSGPRKEEEPKPPQGS